MTVIAYRDGILAADRLFTTASDTVGIATKIVLADGAALAFTGEHAVGLQLVAWWKAGADPKDWPAAQASDERWSRLVVARPRQELVHYERDPVEIPVEGPFWAFGCGQDVALGALAVGAGAVAACSAAGQFHAHCGGGVDFVNLGAAPLFIERVDPW